ncbi:PREDICTED: tail-anchored protein insertion receptor WRB-like [Ceratosolen solmsi marchali]|uniref:Guided entry of tail-anchored proteins factor 1 n=1 Tax=Ceratosolen solmsi marchali TaxID=326594 RepID=A0AAJ7E1P3_9HYME|nr:PREDICTED: tail-anchored protein insertion receptor WRB-like [Ceratosolen solmsi marchali]
MTYLFIVSTLRCFVELLVLIVIKFASVTAWYCSESKEDQGLRNDLLELKREISSISMVDEFAKYAKLQRKYIKLEDKAKESLNNRLALRSKLRLYWTYGIRILNGIFTSILLVLYRKEPVVVFPNGYLWPVEKLLSWPTSVDNCISLPVWIVLMEMSILPHLKFNTS